jgi:WD40 repeat protein
VRAFAISADGRVLATSGDDKTMRLWSLPDGTPLKTFAVEYTPSILTFSPDGTRLAGSIPRLKGGALRLWSLPDGQLLTSFAGQADTVNSIALSPDWSLLATVDDDATIRVWSMPGLTLLKTLSQKTWGYDAAAAVISPNGRLVASMSDDGTIRLWSLPDGAQFKSMKAHTFGGYLAISPDGLVLASAGDSTFDTSIKLWSLPDGKQLPACLMDPSSSSNAAAGVTYTVEGVTYTIPAGAPLPAGAICTCNTVKGSYSTGGCSSFGVYYYPN